MSTETRIAAFEGERLQWDETGGFRGQKRLSYDGTGREGTWRWLLVVRGALGKDSR
jgi:hypothetical protein